MMEMLQECYWETYSLGEIHQDQGIPPGEPPPLGQLSEQVRLLGTRLLTCFLPSLALILLYSFNDY